MISTLGNIPFINIRPQRKEISKISKINHHTGPNALTLETNHNLMLPITQIRVIHPNYKLSRSKFQHESYLSNPI